jgi:hypothetical protein
VTRHSRQRQPTAPRPALPMPRASGRGRFGPSFARLPGPAGTLAKAHKRRVRAHPRAAHARRASALIRSIWWLLPSASDPDKRTLPLSRQAGAEQRSRAPGALADVAAASKQDSAATPPTRSAITAAASSTTLAVSHLCLASITAAAITRSLARSGVEAKLLAWAELYLTQAAAVLPDDGAQDLLSEWQADVRTRFQERGALSAVRWARGIALEAAPAIRQRPDDRRRQVGIKTSALRLVCAGHGPLALAGLFLILRTRLALSLSNNPLTVDTVAVSVALSLWILAETGGTAFAFAVVPRMTVVRPV